MEKPLLLPTPPHTEEVAAVRWRALIVTSHFASAWGERMWEFSAGLLLMTLGGSRSILLPSALALSMMFTQALLGSRIGRCIGRGHVLWAPLVALAGQNVFIALAALSVALFLGVDERTDTAVAIGAALTIGLTCVGKLAALASKVSVENQWAAALSAGCPGDLALLNGQLRRIDLTCKILAPAASGMWMSAFGAIPAGLLVAVVNLAAWPIECACLTWIHRDPWCKARLEESSPRSSALSPQHAHDPDEASPWRSYFSQRIWRSAFALSLLHLTVLSFGLQMTGYVLILGLDPALIAVYRGVGEVFGLAATYASPWFVRRLGWSNSSSAVLFIWLQLLCLVPSVFGSTGWARRNLAPAVAATWLAAGVGVSRLGLWGFDLSVSQMLQQLVEPPSVRGDVIGVQKSLEAGFGTVASLLSVLLPEPDQFQILALVSWTSVCSAALLHTSTLARRK
mmetsp:Transcript_120086/g.345236  ORF Transcript_120086/g.345236 Transcript_120086/m.345236 type:complete len:454 (+) Transcript_120086:42-1403(+)